MAKKFEPIHPLAMAAALEEINARCGVVIMTANTARDLADASNEAQLRILITQVCGAADKLREALWED